MMKSIVCFVCDDHYRFVFLFFFFSFFFLFPSFSFGLSSFISENDQSTKNTNSKLQSKSNKQKNKTKYIDSEHFTFLTFFLHLTKKRIKKANKLKIKSSEEKKKGGKCFNFTITIKHWYAAEPIQCDIATLSGLARVYLR